MHFGEVQTNLNQFQNHFGSMEGQGKGCFQNPKFSLLLPLTYRIVASRSMFYYSENQKIRKSENQKIRNFAF